MKFSEQPLGLQKACVQQRAMRDGRIYVDARFTKGQELEKVEVASCQRDEYFIRFDWKTFVPSPTTDVVLLMLLRKDDKNFDFNAVTEDAHWPEKRAGVMGLSPCGSAFGQVQFTAGGWGAVMTSPPGPGVSF